MQRDRMQGHLQDRRSQSQSQSASASASASASDTPGPDSQQGFMTMTASAPSHSPTRSNQQADTGGGYDCDAASHYRSSTKMRMARDQASQQHASQHQEQQQFLGNATTGSTFTSNTLDVHRRRQWSQTMLDVLQDLSLVLAPDGTIVWAPRTTKALLGFEPTRLVGERMADLIRPDEVAHFVHHFQESMDQQADFYHYYHVRKADGDYHCLEVSGRPHYEAVRDPETGGEMHATRCFFLHARPHPSRAAQALDTFFDIKVENEILRKKLRDMGVMQEDLSEMGLLGDSLLHPQQQQAQAQSSRGCVSQVGNGFDRSQGSLSGPSASSHHHAQAAASPAVEAILAQTQSWQQQQQQQQLHPSQSALGVPGRDSPAISDSFVNAFLSAEDLASEMAHRPTPPVVAVPPLGVLHATASYFYEPGHSVSPALDQRSLLPMPDTRGALGPPGVTGNGASTVQDPRFLSYGGTGDQHIPPSQDFYPFGSPKPFSFGLYAQAGGGGGYGDEATQAYMSQPQQGPVSQQQTPMTAPQTLPPQRGHAQQQQHAQQRPGSASRSLASPTTHAARLLSGQGSSSASQSGSSSYAQRHYTDDTSTPVMQPAMLQPQATPTTSTRQGGGGSHAPGSAKSKKLKKTRVEGGPKHICTDCGTTDSPEWRRGPRGAKTLCNACGLRFAKLQKKAGTEQSAAHSAQQQQQQMEGGRGHTRRASASTTGSGGGK